ncbi:MAG: TadE/TadG family type IV pilus assembly protein [Pirellulaceae bacterium]
MRQKQRGVVTVEFALVLPLVLIIFVSAIEVTHLNFVRQVASQTAYDTARRLIVPGADVAAAEQAGQDHMANIALSQSVTVNAVIQNGEVDVTVRVPVRANSWGLGRLAPESAAIVQACSLSREVAGL